MKRTAFLTLSVLALGVGIYVGGRLWAQTGAPAGGPAPAAAAQPRARIALINLGYVISKYDKLNSYREELKSSIAPFQTRETNIKKTAETLLKEKQAAGTSAPRKEAIEKDLTKLQRDMEDLKNEFNQMMGKKQEQQALIVYGDIRNVAQRYAEAHGIDLVLHYNDAPPTDAREYWSPQNVLRKMQAGALMPIYYTAGMDISAEIIKLLNASFRPAGGAGAAPATGTR